MAEGRLDASHEITSPRSRRVGIASPPPGFALSTSPPIPVRSPLRPVARSLSNASTTAASIASTTTSTTTSTSTLAPTTIVTATQRPQGFIRPATPPPLDIDDLAAIVEDAIPPAFQMHHRSFLPLSHNHNHHHPSPKPLPSRPDSPISVSLDDPEPIQEPHPQPSPENQAPKTKRQHALLELLSSERAYASDLALIREVHMPLALGQPVLLQPAPAPTPVPPSPPHSSASSARTFSTASDSSTAAASPTSNPHAPPMTPEDARIIFNNIAELAVFSDRFCEALELALGCVVDGGLGEDHVGALFTEIIPDLERPYKQYITRHPAALTHLGALPQTPALTAYLAHTQTVAAAHSHAWDLASLLIKPVQRLLKYPLLLGAIIDETPAAHPDAPALREARRRMEEVARNVNEGRRRAEVVKEVLTAKKKGPSVAVGVAASVNLTKMKSLRSGTRPPPAGDANGEAARVERLQAELKRVDVFANQLAQQAVDWAARMRAVTEHLHAWALSFGKVIGISPTQGSEAFDAFVAVVADHLAPLCAALEERVSERLLVDLARLVGTMEQPRKLLASMAAQEPLHYHLLTAPVSARNRPAPALLAASTNYLALRGQLAAELPAYVALLQRGLGGCVRRLARVQAAFWRDVRDQWAELWEMLRVEGEMNAGHRETVGVWRVRWADVDEVMAALSVCQARRLYQDPPGYAESQQGQAGGKRAAPVVNMLAALEPMHSAVAPYAVSGPLPLARSTKTRARGASDASVAATFTTKRSDASTTTATSKKSSGGGRVSTDSLPTGGKTPSKRRTDEFVEYAHTTAPAHAHAHAHAHAPASPPSPRAKPAIPRTKSMPLPSAERTMSHRSSASSKTLVGGEGDSGTSSARHSQELPLPLPEDPAGANDRDRGRSARRPSLRRKFTESFRQRSLSKNNTNPPGSPISFFDDFEDVPASPGFPPPIPHPPPPPPPPPTQPHAQGGTGAFGSTQRDSWVTKRAKYVCQVVHGCQPPAAVAYFSFPFFTLVEGQLYEVLQEAGHPSIHPKLPLYVDDGEDCLLLCRDEEGSVGWALASFLAPLGVTPD